MTRAPLADPRMQQKGDDYERAHLDATLEAARMAIKGLLTVNSAGVVAVLGLISTIPDAVKPAAGFSAFLLSLGTVLALLVFLSYYFGQSIDYQATKGKASFVISTRWHRASIVIWLVSAGLFSWATISLAIAFAFPEACQ